MMYDQSTWELNVMREFYKLKAIDYTDKAKAWNTGLTSSSSDADWLQAALKVIRYENPQVNGGLFHGRLTINSTSKFGYFEVFIYSISDSSQGHYLPSYCIGTWYRNDGTRMGFKTVNGAFTSHNLRSEVDFTNANNTDGGYAVSIASLAGNAYKGQAIDLGTIVSNKYPIFNGFDIKGTNSSNIHTLGHYIYKSGGKWYAYVKMKNGSSTALTNITVTAYIAWITV